MRNCIVCDNCKTENPIYSLTCSKCNSYLRSKISNIDFWTITNKMVESPAHALKTIVYADHKNFIILLIILAALKNSLNVVTFIHATETFDNFQMNVLVSVLLSALIFTLLFISVAFLVTKINKLFEINNRLKDNIALFAYSYIPVIAIFIILVPIYFAMYGFYWFSFNPSPFLIKPTASYIFMFMEILFSVWSCLLFVISMYVQTKMIFYSIFIGIIFYSVVVVGIVYLIGIFNSLMM